MTLVDVVVLGSGGTIGWGPDCDLCTPNVHLGIKCSGCEHTWDEPPADGEFTCSKCGHVESVTRDELSRWQVSVLGA